MSLSKLNVTSTKILVNQFVLYMCSCIFMYRMSHFNQASQFSPKLLMMQKKMFQVKVERFQEERILITLFFLD